MKSGVVASVGVHLVVIGWGLFSFSASPLDASHIETLPVEFIEIAEVTDLELGKKSAEVAETPSPNDQTEKVAETPPENQLAGEDKPKPPPPPPPPPPPEAAPPAPEPEAQPAEAPAPPADAAPEAIPEQAAEEPPPQEAAPPPQQAAAAPPAPRVRPDRPAPPTPPAPEVPTTRDTFTEDIAALIDRSATGTAQMPSQAPASLGVATGTQGARMTQSEIDALRSQITRCWVIPTGWTNPREVTVSVRFQLNLDGTVAGMPEVVEFPASQYGPVAGDNAIRAVMQCGPYALPSEKYEQWKDVQLRFSPVS
jgi:hypothetical protein